MEMFQVNTKGNVGIPAILGWFNRLSLEEAITMADKNKQSEKIAEKNYEPNKKNKSDIDKSLETVHEQINDTFNQGTIDEKEKQEKKKDEKN
jgi:Protein of unknown function (DUF4025)